MKNYDSFMTKNQTFDIFISYRHETGFYMAQALYEYLTGNGYTVFMDKNMSSGKYEYKIQYAAQNCRNFISILFPDDAIACCDENSWLSKEASWALENTDTTMIPVSCDGFDVATIADKLSPAFKKVFESQQVTVHKDYSFDSDMENICSFLKNVTSAKKKLSTTEFFKQNLASDSGITVTSIDVAFHAGAPWLTPGEQHNILMSSLKKMIPWRVLINIPDIAEEIAQNMRDENALYIPFEMVKNHWVKIKKLFPEFIEIRECPIPLIHVYHSIKYFNLPTEGIEKSKQPLEMKSKSHIKYYAYYNTRMDNAFEHEINNFSKFHSLYADEFEYLWERSFPLGEDL